MRQHYTHYNFFRHPDLKPIYRRGIDMTYIQPNPILGHDPFGEENYPFEPDVFDSMPVAEYHHPFTNSELRAMINSRRIRAFRPSKRR
jgi:hypothetical protein